MFPRAAPFFMWAVVDGRVDTDRARIAVVGVVEARAKPAPPSTWPLSGAS